MRATCAFPPTMTAPAFSASLRDRRRTAASTAGLGMASFCAGRCASSFQPRYVSISTNAKEFQKRDFFYAQDTWRPRPSLTINYGMRYEQYFPESVNGKGNGALMELNGRRGRLLRPMAICGSQATGTSPPTWDGVPQPTPGIPRIGIAWSPDSKTVVRTGYGRSFDLGVFGSIFGHMVTQNLPVLANQSLSSRQPLRLRRLRWRPGQPAYVFPAVPSDGLLAAPGFNVSPEGPSEHPAAADPRCMEPERAAGDHPDAFPNRRLRGQQGHAHSERRRRQQHQPQRGRLSSCLRQYSVNGATLHYDGSVPGGVIASNGGTSTANFLSAAIYAGGVAACTNASYEAAANGTRTRRPVALPPGMCGWTQGINYNGDDQNTNFNALQATLAKQFTHGLSFNAQYAWQRSFQLQRRLLHLGQSGDLGPDDWLRTQQFVVYGLYQLPFGKNQMWAKQRAALGRRGHRRMAV